MNSLTARALATVGAILIYTGPTLAADAWPTRPVRIVVPYAPGGSADTLGRLAAQALTEAFGQQFVADNKPGAGGLVGSEMVAKSAPDGYTLVVSGVASHVVAPALNAANVSSIRSRTSRISRRWAGRPTYWSCITASRPRRCRNSSRWPSPRPAA